MGLEGVELIMRLEEAFGVELKDDEVMQTTTPRMVGDLIFSKLKATDKRICQSQRAFYLLRNAFTRHFKIQRGEVTPGMFFRRLIPRETEQEVWMDLKRSVYARTWPNLVRPQWLLWSITVLACAVFVATFIALYKTLSLGAEIAGMAGGISMIGFSIIAAKSTGRFKTRIPARVRRIKDLVPFAVTSDKVEWTRDQVSVLVKQIVLEQLGIPETKYREDADFVKDLGLSQ